MTSLEAKIGDTNPLQRYQLEDKDKAPVDLTGATIVQRFIGAPTSGSPCTIDGDATDGIVYLSSRTHFPTPRSGESLEFSFETEVTFADSSVQTFPTSGYDTWTVWADLDNIGS